MPQADSATVYAHFDISRAGNTAAGYSVDVCTVLPVMIPAAVIAAKRKRNKR